MTITSGRQPSLLPRTMYLYFDPATLLANLEPGYADALRVPRLFFEDAALWETALKLSRVIEATDANSGLCFEALSIVLAHELVRASAGPRRVQPHARGGLAAWQQRTVVEYVEANLAEPISLAKLAQLIHLSPYHFCRTFKQSFGVPPHRYHTSRRIERAKALLANARLLGHDHRHDRGFQRNQLLYFRISQGNRHDADSLPAKPRLAGKAPPCVHVQGTPGG